MDNLTVLILAAGKGTRMKSKTAKVLHRAGGLPILEFVVRAARALSSDVKVVVGHQAEAVEAAVRDVDFVLQADPRGTGHAVMAARESLPPDGRVVILPGDVPLIRPDTLRAFVDFHGSGAFGGSVLTAEFDDPSGYGRIVRRSTHEVDGIVEHRDAERGTLAIREINSGIYVFDLALLFDALERTRTDNAQNEYYLTDVVGILSGDGHPFGAFRVGDPSEVAGINSRKELAGVDRLLRRRKCDALMEEGVSILDPDTAWIDADVEIGADTTIHPSVAIEGPSVLGEDVVVRSFSRITNARIGSGSVILEGSVIVDSEIRDDVRVGPYAHLRMGALIETGARVGNFVEVKKSRLGEGTKAMHLAYIGDADLGRDVNYGAGAITCNYDGVRKNPTVIEDGVFIGSDSQLIAPVRVGRGSYIAAGSTITDDVPADSLAIGRPRQVVKEGWVKEQKNRKSAG